MVPNQYHFIFGLKRRPQPLHLVHYLCLASRAGCIPFTGRVGGQAEIIGGDERLMFDTVGEGVEKILAVLNNPDQQVILRSHLAKRGTLFDSERLVSRIKEAVRQFEGQ